MRATRTAITFVKYLLWTAVAAAINAAVERLGDLQLPAIYVPILAAVLKSIATFVATREPK